MTVRIRPLSGGDLREILAIERQVFPDDLWTLETGKGWLARSPLGGQARNAVRLARLIRLIRLIRLSETLQLIRLTRFAILRRPATRYFIVAEAGGAIAGYACLNAVARGKGDVQTIAVRPECEGKGIGTAMLADLIAAAAARECREIFLDVRADNDRARLLYRRTGFAETARRPGFYQPSGADAIVMRLQIPRLPAESGRERQDAHGG